MSKTITSLLIVGLLCFVQTSFGQLATWNLTTDGTASTVATNVIAGDFTRGNSIGSISYGSSGCKARGWTVDDEINAVDYYEICLGPDAGYNLEVNGLNFSESRTENGIREFEVQWSLDNFTTATTITTISVPDDENERSVSLSSLGIDVCDGETLCFRFFGYEAEEEAGFWSFGDGDLNVTGTVVSPCTPPTVQASNLFFSSIGTASMNINFGSGDGTSRLVVARQGSAVTALPCNGENYAANNQFGFGDDIGSEEYVIYNGTGNIINMYGLIEGATYYVAVFEFNNTDHCYLRTNPLEGSQATLCFIASNVQNITGSAGSKEVTLNWDDSFCQEEVLIIASTAPVTGTPVGDGSAYTANSIYGAGTDSGGAFSDPEFPVYLGTGNSATITELENGTTYYFTIFTNVGTNWSPGIAASFTPVAGCADLGGNDNVFINEIHYANNGDDQDEGVEIFGPAGKDLSFYKIELYSGSGGTVYHTEFLRGIIDEELNGYGALWFPIPDMENGKGGIALYNIVTETVVQFISYRGSIMATDGSAMNMTSTSIGVIELGNTPVGESLQLVGTGNCPADLTWTNPTAQSLGSLNTSQSALPVELIYFRAELNAARSVELNWATAVEVNNDFMAVERSGDGRNFVELGRVKGAGTIATPQDYFMIDPSPLAGINYYRLRQVDFDGTTEIFKTVVVTLPTAEDKIRVFPTVSDQLITIDTREMAGTLQIVNISGQVVQTLAVQGVFPLNIASLDAGHYWIRFENENGLQTERFVKL